MTTSEPTRSATFCEQTSVDPPTPTPIPAPSASAYAELAELSGRLVHELKNHISALGLNLQLLAEDLAQPETPRERQALNRALKLQHECQRLADLSNDFLRFVKLRDLQKVPTDVREVVDELLDFIGPMARQTGIEVKTFLPGHLPRVELDRDLFKQALLNLVLNAIQSMPQGGSLTITAEATDGAIALGFIDTGMGMAPEVLARIFEPFYTTRRGGSGLGLPTLKKVIEAHGGRVQVQSEPGLGTKFTLWLPQAPR